MFEAKKFSEIFDQMRTQSSAVLSDFEPGSVTRTLTEAFAYELGLLYEKMRLVYLSAYVDTAEGTHLDNVVAVLGVQRGLPDFAEGKIMFTRDPGNTDILVPAATIVATEETPDQPKKNYQTLEPLLITKDQIQAEVRIQAVERGEQQNTESETIVVLPRPIPGIKAVNNPLEVKLAGKKRETDDELRRRAKNTLLSAGKATSFAIESALIQLPKVRNVKVVEKFEDPDNYGVIDVYIDHPEFTKNEDPVYNDFENTINQVRAAGILPRIWPSPLTRINATFKIKATQSNLSEQEIASLENKTVQALQRYIDSIPINEALSISKMVKALLLADGVDSLENYRLELKGPGNNLAVKTFADTTDIPAPDNGRFVVDETGSGLKVFTGLKTLQGEAHFKLPLTLDLEKKQFDKEQNDPGANPLMIDAATVVNDLKISGILSAAEKNEAINSLKLIIQPWNKPGEMLLTSLQQVHYGEKAQIRLIPFRHVLEINGAFLIELPPGTPPTTAELAKTQAQENLKRFFDLLAPAQQDQIITFDDMIKAAEENLGFRIKLGQVSDFSVKLNNVPDPTRINSKGIALKKEEKANMTTLLNELLR